MRVSLLKKHTGWTTTWLGKLLALLILFFATIASILNIHPFLAANSPPKNGLLVIEGWLPDYAINQALEIYRTGNYETIVTTGVQIETGSFLIKWKSYSEMTTERLIGMKVAPSDIITVVGYELQRDRTYASAMAMKEQLIADGISQTNIHVVSLGPHGRRSQLLFRKALGRNYSVGITSLEDQSYEAKRWWTSSNGFRTVVSELIAYLYAKIFFRP